ncbi:hypothetical protein V8G54_034842 [Vigna mungo]|uniref:Uncharacterized protein n=1 Tax=Vigna mungo TaxID=3915 RepID=A0AAQ3R9L4_VIGMU
MGLQIELNNKKKKNYMLACAYLIFLAIIYKCVNNIYREKDDAETCENIQELGSEIPFRPRKHLPIELWWWGWYLSYLYEDGKSPLTTVFRKTKLLLFILIGNLRFSFCLAIIYMYNICWNLWKLR